MEGVRNMKRFAVGLLAVTLLLISSITISFASEETKVGLAASAKAAILMDSDTGTIIFSKNADQKLSPASITKVMTLLLVSEAIDRGQITLKDKVRTSEYAASMGGSQIFLEPGEEMTVEELIKGVAIGSANDASVALAEYIAGTEEVFVAKMNQRAKELGLHNTNFVNCNGLPAQNHYSSAHDIAVMSRELLRYEWITKYTSMYQDYLRKNSERPFWLVNTNKLVRFYPGVDGLKTGFTNEAMYCLAATAKKDQFRLIAVVLGEPDPKSRNKEITQMFDYAFSQFTNHVLYKKDEVVAEVNVDKGSNYKVAAVTPHQFGVLSKRGENVNGFTSEIVMERYVKAPINKGDVIGQLRIKNDDKVITQINLVAAEQSDRVKFGALLLRTFKQIISF